MVPCLSCYAVAIPQGDGLAVWTVIVSASTGIQSTLFCRELAAMPAGEPSVTRFRHAPCFGRFGRRAHQIGIADSRQVLPFPTMCSFERSTTRSTPSRKGERVPQAEIAPPHHLLGDECFELHGPFHLDALYGLGCRRWLLTVLPARSSVRRKRESSLFRLDATFTVTHSRCSPVYS